MDVNCNECSHGVLQVPGHKKDLRKLIKFTHYYDGDLIIQQGEVILGHHILCRGNVKILKRHESGKMRLLQVMSTGSLIDRFDLFTEKNRYSCCVEAIMDSITGFIKKEDLLRWIEKHPSVVKKIIASLADELTFQYSRLCWNAWEGSKKRLVRSLLILSDKADTEASFDLHQLTLKDLADGLGIARETLSRHLHWLEAKGAIQLAPGRIEITDKELLKRICKDI